MITSTKRLIFTMRTVFNSLLYAYSTRRAWWFTATSRTRSRFVRTTLGSFWLGISNLLSVAVLATVYGTVFKVSNFSEYVVYLGIGLVVWNSLSSAITSAPSLFDHNANNLKNVSLHPVFYTLEEWAFQLQTFFQSFLLVIVCLLFFQSSLLTNLFTTSFLPLVNLLLFLYWFPLIICLLGVKFYDIVQLVPILMQVAFLLSPILYTKDSLGKLSWFADLNIFYQYLSSLRDSLINGYIDLSAAILLFFINIIGIFFSLFLLARSRRLLPFMV